MRSFNKDFSLVNYKFYRFLLLNISFLEPEIKLVEKYIEICLIFA